jgi:hypothetical protein
MHPFRAVFSGRPNSFCAIWASDEPIQRLN